MTPPPPQHGDDLEALIEEARRRQRRRRRLIGAGVLAAALLAGAVTYLAAGRSTGTQARPRPTPRPAPARPTTPPPQIVFAASRRATAYGEIYRVGLDGHRVNLSRSPAADVSPAVSPDGRLVAFLSDRDGYPALYVVGVDGHGLRRISTSLAGRRAVPLGGQVAWSPDGTRLTASAARVWTGGLDGRGTLFRGYRSVGAAPAPDGRVLAVNVEHVKHVLAKVGGPYAHDVITNELRVVDAGGRTLWRVRRVTGTFAWSKTGRLAVQTGAKHRRLRVYDEQGHLLDAFPAAQLAWSPSGDRLASIWHGRVEIRRGGTGSRVATFPARSLVSWPSARLLYIFREGRDLAINPSTGDEVRIPLGPAAISLDGSRFVFADSTDLEVAGRRLVRRPACPGSEENGGQFAGVQFTPDGRSVVYQTACGGPPANIYAVDPDGSHLRRLTATAQDEGGPAISPDGTRLAFSKGPAPFLCNKGCVGAIWVAARDGRHARELTHPEGDEYDSSASWSPDGRRIVFSRSTAAAPTSLYVVESGNPSSVRPLHVAGYAPSWGPKRIAFIGFDTPSVWTVRPDGSGRHRVATGREISSLAWSKDGRLAFLDGYPPDTFVHVLGAKLRLPVTPTRLTWSPDGTHLLLAAARGTAPSELYTLDLRTRRLEQLTFGLGDIAGMSWR